MKKFGFKPWIGEKYLKSGFQGKKVLVLGESHYLDKESHLKFPVNEFTRACIGAQIGENLGDGVWTHKYFTRIAATFINKLPNQKGKKEFWESVIFYNFIQEFLPRSGMPPTNQMFFDGVIPFQMLLSEYKPDFIFVFSYRLWNYIKDEYDIENLGTYTISGKKRPVMLCDKSNDSKKIFVLPIYHPSRGFSWKFWHQHVNNVLNNEMP